MKKRMACFISEQLLPNYIPVNEPATRPDVLHAIYTPEDSRIAQKWRLLRDVLKKEFPTLELEEIPVDSAYDAQKIRDACENVLREHSGDSWSLNMTGGTKLMSSPAVEVFRARNLPIYYVETPRNRTLQISDDWTTTEHSFEQTIDLATYFALHGREVNSGEPQSGQEKEVYQALQKLDWQVWASVRLFAPSSSKGSRGGILAEYDVIGIHFYQLFAFECKRLTLTRKAVQNGHVPHSAHQRTKDDILKDLYKLAQVRQSFGGPFGRSYWVFSGGAALSPVNCERIKEFRIRLVMGNEIQDIGRSPEKFGLPPVRAVPGQQQQSKPITPVSLTEI